MRIGPAGLAMGEPVQCRCRHRCGRRGTRAGGGRSNDCADRIEAGGDAAATPRSHPPFIFLTSIPAMMSPWQPATACPRGTKASAWPMAARYSCARSGPRMRCPCARRSALLQPDEVRQRFLYPMKELSAEQAQRLTRPNTRREFALVVAEPLPPGEALIGAVARIAVDDDGRAGEFAILVSHYINGMGLGRHLMRRLVRWAKGRKLERIYGEVLESNLPMQALAASLDFRREHGDSPGLVRMVLDVPKPKATHRARRHCSRWSDRGTPVRALPWQRPCHKAARRAAIESTPGTIATHNPIIKRWRTASGADIHCMPPSPSPHKARPSARPRFPCRCRCPSQASHAPGGAHRHRPAHLRMPSPRRPASTPARCWSSPATTTRAQQLETDLHTLLGARRRHCRSCTCPTGKPCPTTVSARTRTSSASVWPPWRACRSSRAALSWCRSRR